MNVGFVKKGKHFCPFEMVKKGAKTLFGLQMKSLVQWLAPLDWPCVGTQTPY